MCLNWWLLQSSQFRKWSSFFRTNRIPPVVLYQLRPSLSEGFPNRWRRFSPALSSPSSPSIALLRSTHAVLERKLLDAKIFKLLIENWSRVDIYPMFKAFQSSIVIALLVVVGSHDGRYRRHNVWNHHFIRNELLHFIWISEWNVRNVNLFNFE